MDVDIKLNCSTSSLGVTAQPHVPNTQNSYSVTL